MQTRFVPLTGGRLTVRAGAASTKVSVRVSGWVLDPTASAGRPGTVTPVPAALVPGTDVVVSTASRLVSPLGRGAVPRRGVSAVLVSVQVSTASKQTYASVGGAVVAAGVPGHTSVVQVLVRLDGSGRLSVGHSAGKARIRLEIVGWVSSADPYVEDGAGVWTRLGTAGVALDTRAGVGAPKSAMAPGAQLTIPVAGRNGVPAMSSSAPPTFVLVEASTSATAKKDAVLTAGPAGSSPVATLSAARPGTSATTSTWLPLARDGAVRFKNVGAGAAQVSVRVLGWGLGTVLTNPKVVVLSAVEANRYGKLDAGDGQLTLPAGAVPPKTGAILASGPTSANPGGLLVRVLGVAPASSGFVVTTRPSSLAEAVRRGLVTTPVLFDATPGTASRQNRGASARRAGTTRSFTASQSFHREFPGDTASASVSGRGDVTATGQLSVGIGWRGLKGEASVAVDESLSGDFKASGGTSWADEVLLGKYEFRWFVFEIGPIPVVVRPGIDLSLTTHGSVSGAVEVQAAQSAHARIGLQLDGGLDVINEHSQRSPALQVTKAEASFHADLGLEPSVSLEFYTVGHLRAGADLALNADWSFPECDVVFSGTVDGILGADLEVLGHGIQKEWSKRLATAELGRVPLPLPSERCKPWLGTVSWTFNNTHRTANPSHHDSSVEHDDASFELSRNGGLIDLSESGHSSLDVTGTAGCDGYTRSVALAPTVLHDVEPLRWSSIDNTPQWISFFWYFAAPHDGTGSESYECGVTQATTNAIRSDMVDVLLERASLVAPTASGTFRYDGHITAAEMCALRQSYCPFSDGAGGSTDDDGSAHVEIKLTRAR